MRHRHPARHGFTLVELVTALVVLGMMAAALVVFIRPALEGFLAARQRSRLVSEADQAARRMLRDIRSTVPNSIRSPSSACFELVPTLTGGRRPGHHGR